MRADRCTDAVSQLWDCFMHSVQSKGEKVIRETDYEQTGLQRQVEKYYEYNERKILKEKRYNCRLKHR
jgi:hypothetical protein